jgi:acetolactate synthase I/II/III large subunit
MTGSEALLKTLEAHGVRHIFGHPGGAIMPVYDALYDSPIQHILVRHEQGGGHAAEGYARATGGLGVCMATSGPGATNLVTALADAMLDSLPILAITGNVPSPLLGTDAFQEADITGITMPITKHNFLVRNADDVSRTVAKAIAIALEGRPGPVLVDIPKDVQQAQTNAEIVQPHAKPPRLEPNPEVIAKAVALIKSAKQPLLIVGGGSCDAAPQILEFAKKTGMPVITTLMGLGNFPASDPQWLGMPGMHGSVASNRAISQCDVLIGLGMRFDDRVTGKTSRFAKNAQIIHIDIDTAEHNKLIPAFIPIHSDSAAALEALTHQVTHLETPEWWEKLRDWQARQPKRPTWGAAEAIKMISSQLNGNDIVVADVGQHQMLTAQLHPFEQPRKWSNSGGAGTMGFCLPAAMGAAVAINAHDGGDAKGVRVIGIAGDGSSQMTIQELATLRKYDIPVKFAVINNGYLGMVRQWQEMFHSKRYSEVYLEDSNPDFPILASAYRIPGFAADNATDLAEAIQNWLNVDGPAVLEVRVPQEANVFPMVPAGKGLDEMLDDDPKFLETKVLIPA